MTGSSIKYLTKEGFRNIWTNRMMSVASIAVLMSCLVLIGSAAMMFLNIESLLSRIEEENVVMVFIQDEATEEQVKALEAEAEPTSGSTSSSSGDMDFGSLGAAFDDAFQSQSVEWQPGESDK